MLSAYCFNGKIGIYARGVTEGVLVVWNFICLGSDYLCASGNVGYTVNPLVPKNFVFEYRDKNLGACRYLY